MKLWIELLALAGVCWWLFGGSEVERWEAIEKRFGAHARVVWTTDPAHEATILWSTDKPSAAPRLYLFDRPPSDPARRPLRRIVDVTSVRFPDPREEHIEAWQHRVDLRELEPSRSYWFEVEHHSGRSRSFWFRTAPIDDRVISFLSGGDCLDRRQPRREMNHRMAQVAHDDPQILCLAHAGDFVRNGESLREWLEWLDDHEVLTGPDGQLLPLVVARGNHEAVGPLFDFVFGAPGGKVRNYYRTPLGSTVVLLTLNTEYPAEGDQRQFLVDALSGDQDREFRLAQYHRGLFPAVRQAFAGKSAWLPVFDRFHLDFGLESNGHTLKRTPPIRAGAIDPEGTVFLGEGGFGAKQRSPRNEDERNRFWTQAPGGFVTRGDHVWKLRFEHGQATAHAILANGEIADTYRRTAR